MKTSSHRSNRQSDPKTDYPQNTGFSKSRQRTPQQRALIAEFFGTFMFTFVAAGGEVIEAASGQPLGHAAKVIAPGILIMVMIYTLGESSGAHFNPAITIAFALRGDFPGKRIFSYCFAQILGALSAIIFLRILFGNVGHLGATFPDPTYGVLPALAMEMILTFLLIFVIFSMAKDYRLLGDKAALIVGSTILLCGLFASPISGASMNPARSLAPALISATIKDVWIYIVGPFLGIVLAIILDRVLHGKHQRVEMKSTEEQNNTQISNYPLPSYYQKPRLLSSSSTKPLERR